MFSLVALGIAAALLILHLADGRVTRGQAAAAY
jgi:hypothetical protein